MRETGSWGCLGVERLERDARTGTAGNNDLLVEQIRWTQECWYLSPKVSENRASESSRVSVNISLPFTGVRLRGRIAIGYVIRRISDLGNLQGLARPSGSCKLLYCLT